MRRHMKATNMLWYKRRIALHIALFGAKMLTSPFSGPRCQWVASKILSLQRKEKKHNYRRARNDRSESAKESQIPISL